MSKNISFVIFTYNEEQRIEYVIKNFINYGDVLVMDYGSTDRTKEIAEQCGATYILRPKMEGHIENEKMLAFVEEQVKTDWIYWGHADQMMPKQLLDKLAELSKQDRYKYVYLPFHTYLFGDVEHVMLKGSYPIFFRKGFVDFSTNKMHGLGRFTGESDEVLWLLDSKEYAVRHYSLYDVNKFVAGHLKYANMEAQQKFEDGKKFSVYRLIGGMVRYFFMYYKLAWRSGIRGLIASLLNAFFRGMVYMRLYELEHDITLESIETQFREDKIKLLEDLK